MVIFAFQSKLQNVCHRTFVLNYPGIFIIIVAGGISWPHLHFNQ